MYLKQVEVGDTGLWVKTHSGSNPRPHLTLNKSKLETLFFVLQMGIKYTFQSYGEVYSKVDLQGIYTDSFASL